MIEILQKDFEAKVQDIIDGKTTRTKLLEELKIDRVTLNNKIQELAVSNPALYKAFIIKFPYRPREYTHIDYEALIIDILKKGYTSREIEDVYEGITRRTIQRKIKEMEEEKSELINLYKAVAKYRKAQKELPIELKRTIAKLESREIFISGVCDKRKEELLERKNQYDEARDSGMGVRKASEAVGQPGRVSKSIYTLNRIKLEEKYLREDNDTGER